MRFLQRSNTSFITEEYIMHDERTKPFAKRPPLRETIMDMDRDLLKMLARRSNILGKMSSKLGHLDPREERELRASWEKYATAMSKDPRLIRQLFSILQDIEFLPKPVQGEERRPAFNLAPAQRPIDVRMKAPVVSRRSRLFLSLAAVSGSALHIHPSLLNDDTVECIKMFNQCATSLAWDDDGTVRSREGGGLSLPDKIIYVGNDALNFFLLLAHYVGKVSRAKFTGESSLKQKDLSTIRHFLPQLGARMTSAIPGGIGFPVRIECSGVLPDSVIIPPELDADMVLALCMAAPFWEKPISLDLTKHPAATAIIEEACSVLEPSNVLISKNGLNNTILHYTPCTPKTPLTPALGMELSLAAYLLALPIAAGGQIVLEGNWPTCALAKDIEQLLAYYGAQTVITPTDIQATSTAHTLQSEQQAQDTQDGQNEKNLPVDPFDATTLDPRFIPLAVTCALLPALRGKQSRLPLLPDFSSHPSDIQEEIALFLAHLGFEATEDGTLKSIPKQHTDPQIPQTPWTAPSPLWAMAYALCAFARSGLKLVNPGDMTALYPLFWSLYNALPCPHLRQNDVEPKNEKPVRRRIIAADQAGIGSGNSDS